MPAPAAPDLAGALADLDQSDRLYWQVAGLLEHRRPPGADRIIGELKRTTWRARLGRLVGRLWPGRHRPRPARRAT